jgi:hypothetical protein
MKALFDSGSYLVGWVSDDHADIYDAKMRWAGYVAGENAWNSQSNEWIGPVVNGNIHDQTGRPIAWSNRDMSSDMSPIRPTTPMKPMTPIPPMRPMTPMTPLTLMPPTGGWSQSSFSQVFK